MKHKDLRGTDLHSPSNELVENPTGSTIPSLIAVKWTGMGAYPQIARANGATDLVRGVTQSAILSGGLGYITSLGFLLNVDTSLWVVGTKLYADSVGALTTSAIGLPIAFVMKQHAQFGVLYIENTGITKGDLEQLEFPDALSLELQWMPAYASFYTEATYDMAGKVTDVDMWESSAKVIHLFNKHITYNMLNQAVDVLITRIYDGQTLHKVLTYDLSGKVETVTRTYTI